MRTFIVLMAAALALLAQPAMAQPKWAVGQTYSGNIDLGGVQMPLPSGDWVVAGFQSSVSKWTLPGTGSNMMTVGLVQFAGKSARAYTVLTYNERSMSAGWTVGDAVFCDRKEIHHAMIARDRQLDKSCQYVNHIITWVNARSPQWWKDSVDYAEKNGVGIAPVAIVAGAVVSDRADFLSASYYFNPAAVGFPASQNTTWETSDWNKINVAGDEKKKAFVQSVIEWTEKMRPVVEAGLAGKLKTGEGLDWPAAMQASGN